MQYMTLERVYKHYDSKKQGENTMKKRIMCWVLSITVFLSSVPAAYANTGAQTGDTYTYTYVNPAYENEVSSVDLQKLQQTGSIRLFSSDAETYETTIASAASKVRAAAKKRSTAITVYYQSASLPSGQLATDIWNSAMAHTGVPNEGDYLSMQYGGWSCNISLFESNGIYYSTLTYTVSYYTTAAQEERMNSEVAAVLSKLNLSGKSDYEKIKGIYDYICKNVTYDCAHENDDSYYLKYTAYGALVNKTAICQGYPLLFCRLALELGVDARFIGGYGEGDTHAWAIVKLGGKYYNVDPTWDAINLQKGLPYKYFLRCNANFSNHTRDFEYTTTSFNNAYPMAGSDFNIDETDPGQDIILSDEIVHLIFADMAYARIPSNFKNKTVSEWLKAKTWESITGKAGYDKKEMTDNIFNNSEQLSRVDVFKMVGDWIILDVINGEAGYAANVFQKGNDIIIAYRGSEEGPSSIGKGEDWWVDAEFSILNSLDPRQFGDTDPKYGKEKGALNTYLAYAGKGNVTITGHSLGGALVAYVSTLTGAKGYAFDGAVGHVIDLTYLYEPLAIDFHSKDQMSFINYTDPERLDSKIADLIQHTNADLFPGICYQSNTDFKDRSFPLAWTHNQYSNTILSEDGTKLEFMPVAEQHYPKDNWYASVDYSYLGIATGGISGAIAGAYFGGFKGLFKGAHAGIKWGEKVGRMLKIGTVYLGTENDDEISVLKSIESFWDVTAATNENVLYGGDGGDTLIGAASSDILIPGASNSDRLSGGLGNDVYLIDAASRGNVQISDYTGNDVIRLKNGNNLVYSSIQPTGYDLFNECYGFKIQNGPTIYLSKSLLRNSFKVMNDSDTPICIIDTKGNISRPVARRDVEVEAECKEVTIEGVCEVDIFAPNGTLAGKYDTSCSGLYPEEFGVVYISDSEGEPLLSATLYADYRLEVSGNDRIDVAIVGSDAEYYVDQVTSAKDVDLFKGVATIEPEKNQVSQGDVDAVTSDYKMTTSIEVNENEKRLIQGETAELTATAFTEDGTMSKDLFWVSNDPSVVTCDYNENGNCIITAVGSGDTEVYAVAEDSGVFAVTKVHSYIEIVTAPTCTIPGYSTFTCLGCGDSYVGNELPALGHSFGAWITFKSATCTEAGEETRTCSRCGEKDTKAIAALGHDWGVGVVTKEPTETTKGERSYTCSRCGEKRTEEIPELSHVHSYIAMVTAPTCTEKGYTTYTCSCGESYVDNETAALGHSFGVWITTKASTCTDAGEETRTCSRCGEKEYRAITVTGHDFKAVVTEPTCMAAGFITYTCSKCGDSYTGDEVAMLGHDYKDGICTRCGGADPDYLPPIDRAALQAAIAIAEKIDRSKYTDETVAAMEAALTAAKAALEAEKPADVNDAAATLDAAVKALKEKSVLRFDDVKDPAQYYYEPVYWAVDKSITTGTGAATFSPNAGCTRAQVVTFLWRAAGEPEPTKGDNPFQDVKPNAYYYKAVLWAVEKGITTGTSATTFRPDATCTRGQIVTFLWRYNDMPEPTKTDNPFADVKADQYYYKAVLWAVEKGITKGTSDSKFSPDSTCTRGQIVTFLYRDKK